MKTICNVPCPEDGLVFDLDSLRISMIRSEQAFPSQRAKLNCYLGSARILTQVDFGFGDVVTAGAEQAKLKTLIGGVPEPSLLVYPLSTSVAEKFEAMVRFGQRNSRMKDFHDIWALWDRFLFDGEKLRRAIRDCFSRRGTDLNSETPVALTSGFYSDNDRNTLWRNYRVEIGPMAMAPPPESFGNVGERLQRFLEPIHAKRPGRHFVRPLLAPWWTVATRFGQRQRERRPSLKSSGTAVETACLEPTKTPPTPVCCCG